jgi:site-specific DNA-cytosine methylase/adenine/guanine phosphoribosyltransferase-like PRPP-binding protein
VNDDAIANIGEYARLGVEPTLIALATGVIDSSDEEELKTMIGQGLVFSLGGRAVQQSYHKFLGEDPVIAARRAKQANVDALKAYRDSTPETKGEIDKLTDWDLVIGRQAKKVADTEAEVQKLVNESPDAKKIEDAEKRLEAEKKSLSLLKTANVQTRNEFGRQFLNQLGRNNALLNGTLRAGQNNVGINILSTQQIFDHFRKNPQWQNVPDEVLMEYASQQGFYSGTGGTEFRPGVNVSDTARSMTFDPAKPSVVINSDALRNRIELFGETPIDALNHETGHAILRIKEIQDAVADASKLLFTNEITDASGNVKEITTGLYSEEQLNSLFKDQYLKNRSKDEIARLGSGLGLWDANTNSLNKKKVANYMQEEILAELFSNTLSRNLGKNIDSKQVHLIDIARLKLKNKLFKNAVTKMLGLGMDGDVFSKATGAILTPDAQSASRNALRILQSINGDVTTIAEQPETAPISKADIRKSKIAAERYGMDSGLFATKVQAQVFDADGNPVGDAVDVTDPSVFEGSWRISKDGEERLSGYGQIPLELRQLQVPEGGTLSIKKKIITEVDGVTPQLLKPSDLRKIKKDRATLFKQAIDTPDYGTPGRFEPVSEGSESYRGTFTPAQIKAIQELPEGIVPLKIKKYLLELNEAIVRRDGTRFFVDYAAVMDDNGNYKAFSPKIYDVVPIGLQLSTAGNFLVTTISVGRMMSKLNAWSDRMPNRLSPWNGSKEAFWNEFSTRYLDNWSKGIQGSGYNERGEAIGSNQLSDDVAVAEQKKSIFNDFLNLFKNETEVLNLDRTKIPKRKGDEKNKSIDRTIMSMRIDHMAELLDAQDLPKLPIDYGKALINFLPAETSEIEAPSGERGFQSKLQMEIQSKFRGAMATPEQLKAVLNNPQNVKAEEVKWSGVNDAIDRLASENNGKVPVQELLNYLRDEGQVKFEEVVSGKQSIESSKKVASQNIKEILEAGQVYDGDAEGFLNIWNSKNTRLHSQAKAGLNEKLREAGETRDVEDILNDSLETETRFSDYQLPGGENYREVVMAMPYDLSRSQAKIDAINKRRKEILNISKEQDLFKRSQTDPEAKALNDSLGAEFVDLGKQADQLNADIRDGKTGEQYTSSHFSDIPNYVAHMRLNERTDAEGNDGLFIEELQSDRHQAGREKGYNEDLDVARREELRNKEGSLTDAEMQELGELNSKALGKGIPDAPFRKDWSLQLFKRALRDAVESGKQWIGWTTGDTQAERYDLSKQIDRIDYSVDEDGLFSASAIKGKSEVFSKEGMEIPEVEATFGKEIAEKMQSNKGKKKENDDGIEFRSLAGLDLKVGGEGMKVFYDQILPKEIGKYVAKMGGKVEKNRIIVTDMPASEYEKYPDGHPYKEKNNPQIWRVNITPQMANVVRAGQLQFLPAEISVPTQEKLDELKSKLPNYQSIVKNIDDTQKHILVSDKNGFPAAFSEVSINKDNNSLKIDWVNTIIKKQGFAQALYREIAKYAQEQNLDTIEGDIVNDQARKRREELLKTISETQEPLGDDEYSTALVSKVPSDIRFLPAEQGAEPEGLQGIELPTQYRRISDMIPPLRDVEPLYIKLFSYNDLPANIKKEVNSYVENPKNKFWKLQQVSIQDLMDNSMASMTGDTLGDYDIDALVKSITKEGIKKPITMVRNADGSIDLEGNHRVYAAYLAGIDTIPAYILQKQDILKQNKNFEISNSGDVFVDDLTKPLKFTQNISLQFLPASPEVNLEDYIDKPIIALTADRMGVGKAYVGPEEAKKEVSQKSQGGPGFSFLYTDEKSNPVWGFTRKEDADRFVGRVTSVANKEKTDSVLVAPTLLSPDNHLHNPTGQLAYAEAIDAAIKVKFLDAKLANSHIEQIMQRVSAGKGLPKEDKDKFSAINTLSAFVNAVKAKEINFRQAALIREKAAGKTLPIGVDDMIRMGILPSEVAKNLAHKGFYELPTFSVVSLFEVPANSKPEKGEYHYSYPWIVRGKSIGFLKNIYNLDKLTSATNVRSKTTGELSAQPVMVVMPQLDPEKIQEASSALKNLKKLEKPLGNLQFLPQQIEEKIIETAVKNKDGSIISYPNKNHAMIMEETDYNLDVGEFPPMENFGFITNTGRFVNQKEAQEIAKKSKQVEGSQQISGELVSKQNIAFLPEQIDSSTSVKSLTENKNYKDAKYNGNPMFAYNLAKKFLTDEVIASVNSKINPEEPAIIIPVSAIEGEDLNTIPLAVADILSWKLNIPVSVDIVKTSKQHNTGASAQDRASNIHFWSGKKPKEGTQIILVDDTYTTGQTLRSLANYVGEPTAIVTLASGRYGKKFDLPIDLEKKLLDKAGITKEDFISNYGKEPNAVLTGAQTQQYLLNGAKGKEGLFRRFPSRLGKAETRSDSQLQDAGRNRRVDTEEYIGLNFLPSDKDSDYAKQLEFAFPKGPKTLTYFSGIGTWEQGLKGEIDPQYAVEYDPAKAAAYRAANGDHMIEGDVTQIDPKRFIGIEYFHASPVCKNYSLLKDPTRGCEESDLDIRSADAVNRVLETCKPKFFTLENVGGYKKSDAYASIKKTLTDLGYKFDEAIYKANEYGSPTDRKRLLLRATLSGELPTPIKKQGGNWYDTIEDIVNDLPDAPLKGANFIWRELNKVGIDPENVPYPILIAGGGSFQQVPWRSPDEPAYTFTTNQNNLDRILLPGGISKRVTGRAKARMSGFSDDFILPDNDRLANIVIGNGVPPDLVKNVIGPMFENK